MQLPRMQDLQVISSEPGRVLCSLGVKPQLQNRYGTLHGGAIGGCWVTRFVAFVSVATGVEGAEVPERVFFKRFKTAAVVLRLQVSQDQHGGGSLVCVRA